MKRSTRLMAMSAWLCSFAAHADTMAIVNARAWTMTSSAPVENATIVVSDGKVVSVAAGTSAPAGARVIDAQGKTVTPGLVHAATHLGLIEVSAATETTDGSVASGPLGAGFDVQYAINANSTLISLARADGVTRAVTYPSGSAVAPFAGTGAALRLSHAPDLVERPGIGVFASIGGGSSKSAGGSRAAQWKLLRIALDAAKTALAKPADASTRTPEIVALEPVLAAKVPLALSLDRESDIRQAIRLAADYELRVVIIGGADAWRVAPELAAAKIPVVVDPQSNLPMSFDTLGARLDNAALLHRAGVTVAIVVLSGIQQSYNAGLSLREGAGLAVANGLPYIEALRAITATPALIWGLADRAGTIGPGRDADLVIWDGDPLEPSSLAVAVLVQGREMPLATRQKQLRDRYLPRAGISSAQ